MVELVRAGRTPEELSRRKLPRQVDNSKVEILAC